VKIRIDPLPIKTGTDVRQRFRPDLDNHAFGSSDLFQRATNIGILLKRSDHRLVDPENRRTFFGPTEAASVQRSGLN
jgi:hypothetical protein